MLKNYTSHFHENIITEKTTPIDYYLWKENIFPFLFSISPSELILPEYWSVSYKLIFYPYWNRKNAGNKAKWAYQGVRNVCFSVNLACFVFLKHPFWDPPFCLIILMFIDFQQISSWRAHLANILIENFISFNSNWPIWHLPRSKLFSGKSLIWF